MDYREAGVDLEAAAKAVALIGGVAQFATRAEVVESVGGFAGLFRIGPGKLLAAATDGVGTKLEIARMAGRLDSVGIDLVAMCADDVVCTGAEPLFLLDYVAVGKVVPEEVAALVEGVAEGCRRAGCALLGGETAEHPGTMAPGQFDLAGFCVGVVDEGRLLGPQWVKDGDLLVGLASTGLHANGFSLVRRALLGSDRHDLSAVPAGLDRSLGEELLEPTAIYAPLVLALARDDLIRACAHVTGGGLPENLPRALPPDLGASVDPGAWPRPPVFELVRRAAGASEEEMFATFNMGLGMVLVVAPDDAEAVVDRAEAAGTPAWVVGRVEGGPGVRLEAAG
jgi:phosphoribosylformylglycinamidine cyclo-ligase